MGKMQLPEEFKEFIELLNENGVKYILLGGWAVGCYGNPRATKDIDFLVSVDDSNLKKLKKTFDDFKSPPIDVEILKEDKGYIFFRNPPIRIEVISNADGINIKECYKRKNIDMKERKKDSNYYNDFEIVNKTIMLYNNALETKMEKDVFTLHNSFKKNPMTNKIYDDFKYKKLRNNIYNEIEYRFKLLLKNEYSHLKDND